jgi:hypothetical protein
MVIPGYYLNDLRSRRSLLELVNSDRSKMRPRDRHNVLSDLLIMPIPENQVFRMDLGYRCSRHQPSNAIVTKQSHNVGPLSYSRYFSIRPRNKVAHVSVILELIEIFE